MPFLTFLRENRAFLLAGFLLSFTSSFGQTYFISIYADQIKDAYGLTDGGWGAVYTVGTSASALVMVWAGGLTDRFRVRALVPAVATGLAAACLMMAVSGGTSWAGTVALCGVIFAVRLFGQGMMSHLAVVAMARWFVATRGRALSISAMGHAAGQALLPIAFVALMGVVDWRWLWVGAAGLVLTSLPVLARLLRLERTPQSISDQTQVAGLLGRHWTRGEVLRHPLFWFMVPVLLGPPAWGTALFFQQVHFTGVKGWALADFVALTPLYVGVGVVMTFASGWAIDRFGTGRIAGVYMLPFALGFFILSASGTIPGAALALAVLGLGTGIQATLPGAFWAEHFGTRHVGSIKATAAAIMVFGSAIGPGISGALIDLGVDFTRQMVWIGVYFLAAGALAAVGVGRVRGQLRPALSGTEIDV